MTASESKLGSSHEISNSNGNANMKDLWYSRKQIIDLKNSIEAIKKVYISDKSGYTVQNELTKYRFDAIYEIQF